MMAVVSPTNVAAPCRLEDTAMAMMMAWAVVSMVFFTDARMITTTMAAK